MKFISPTIILYVAAAALVFLPGCRGGGQQAPYGSYVPQMQSRNVQNPLAVPGNDPYAVWETVVDVVRLYFSRIQEEIPCQRNGEMMTEGLLVTHPQVGATLLEPWRRDSVTPEERKEATMQSVRRVARVRVRPTAHGYMLEVRVNKELEDMAAPSMSRLPSATFRLDTELPETHDPISVQDYRVGWIPLGRDVELEREILLQLQTRLCQP